MNLSPIRDASWLTQERVRVYGAMLAIAFAGAAVWIWYAQTFLVTDGYVLGGDFVSFYAAARLGLEGHAPDAWNRAVHAAMEARLSSAPQGYLAFFYPPAYLVMVMPFGLLPYGLALLAWLTITNGAALAIMWKLLRSFAPDIKVNALILLSFPAVWINMGCGQNGALSLAILAAGALLIDRRPIVAGLILGLLVIKPHLAVVLPFALAASGRWRTFFATGAGAMLACLGALMVVGQDGYAAFFDIGETARRTLVEGAVDPAQMQSLFAALRLLGVDAMTAGLAQALLSVTVLAATAWTAWRCRPQGFALVALIVSATVLATPFLLDYDLLITAVPLGWLALSSARTPRPWERLVLLAAFVLPIAARQVAMHLHVPLSPFILAAVFIMVVTRLRAESGVTVPAAQTLPSPA